MPKAEKPYVITVGTLLDQLQGLPRADLLYFGSGDLSHYRVKPRGDHLHQIEFNQLYTVTLDPEQD